MAKRNPAAPAGLGGRHGDDSGTLTEEFSVINADHAPHFLREALQSAGRGIATTPTDSASEEDYDDQFNKPVAVLMTTEDGPSKRHAPPHHLLRSGSGVKTTIQDSEPRTPSDISSEAGQLEDLTITTRTKMYAVESDDKELRAILKRGMQRVSTLYHDGEANGEAS